MGQILGDLAQVARWVIVRHLAQVARWAFVIQNT